jgi:hypothetical protein
LPGGEGTGIMATVLDAARLVGLLAEPDRRRVVAALILASDDVARLVQRTGLPARAVVDALDRLQRGGLVDEGSDGTYVVLEEAFKLAARAAAPPPGETAHPDAPPDVRRVLDGAFRDGRLVRFPTRRGHRRVVLDEVAQRFEPGRRYSERQVNANLAALNEDTAMLRRWLVDEGFMGREAGEYWRTGGTVA